MENYSAIKKNQIMPSASTRMDLETIILSEEVRRERQISYNNTYQFSSVQSLSRVQLFATP